MVRRLPCPCGCGAEMINVVRLTKNRPTLTRTESDRSTRLLHRHAVEYSTYPRALGSGL